MHVRRALALAVSVPLLLAGCSDDPEPTPKIPDPTTSSPTDPVTETETPEAESPEDFIRRWQQASDDAQTTGNTTAYRALTVKCDPCDGFADRVDEIYAAGGRVEFGGSEVLGVRGDGPDSSGYTVRIRSGAGKVFDSRGASPSDLQGGEFRLHVFLKQSGESWLVGHYTTLPSA